MNQILRKIALTLFVAIWAIAGTAMATPIYSRVHADYDLEWLSYSTVSGSSEGINSHISSPDEVTSAVASSVGSPKISASHENLYVVWVDARNMGSSSLYPGEWDSTDSTYPLPDCYDRTDIFGNSTSIAGVNFVDGGSQVSASNHVDITSDTTSGGEPEGNFTTFYMEPGLSQYIRYDATTSFPETTPTVYYSLKDYEDENTMTDDYRRFLYSRSSDSTGSQSTVDSEDTSPDKKAYWDPQAIKHGSSTYLVYCAGGANHYSYTSSDTPISSEHIWAKFGSVGPQQIDSGGKARHPAIGINSDGDIYIAYAHYNSGYKLNYKKFDSTGSTTIIDSTTIVESTGYIGSTSMAITSNDNVYVASIVGEADPINGLDGSLRVDHIAGSGSDGIILSETSSVTYYSPTLVADHNNNVIHLVYEKQSSSGYGVYYKYLDLSTGNWSDETTMISPSSYQKEPSATIDENGNLHVVYCSNSDSVSYVYKDNTPPTTPVVAELANTNKYGTDHNYVRSANLQVVWSESTDDLSGLDYYAIFVNGVSLDATDASHAYKTVSVTNEGYKRITVRAYDHQGNYSTGNTINCYVDLTSPEVTDLTVVKNADNTFSFEASVSDNISGIETDPSSGADPYPVTLYYRRPSDSRSSSEAMTYNSATGHWVATAAIGENNDTDIEGLVEGVTYSYYVKAYDITENSTNSATATYLFDITSPEVNITAPAAGYYRTTSFTLTGTATDSGSGISTGSWITGTQIHWKMNRPDDLLSGLFYTNFTTAPTFSTSDHKYHYSEALTCNVEGAYTVYVNAVDIRGNTGQDASTFWVDLTAPEVSNVIVNGLNIASGSTVYTSEIPDDSTRNIQISATDNISLESITVTVMHNGVAVTPSSSTYSAGVQTIKLSSVDETAPYFITARATDRAGNVSTLFRGQFVYDNTDPVVAITSPTSGSVFGTSEVIITGTFTETNISSISVEGVAATLSLGTFIATVEGLSDGEHSLSAIATDLAGNHQESSAISITVDTTAPSILSGTYNESAFTFSYDVSDDTTGTTSISLVLLKRDEATHGTSSVWNPYSTQSIYSGRADNSIVDTVDVPLPNGNYQAYILATDEAGNTAYRLTDTFLIGSTLNAWLKSVAPTINSYTNSIPAIYFSAEASNNNIASYFLTVETVGGTTAPNYYYYSWSKETDDTEYHCDIPSTSPMPSGNYQSTIYVFDANGNEASDNMTFSVDAAVPSIESKVITIGSSKVTIECNVLDSQTYVKKCTVRMYDTNTGLWKSEKSESWNIDSYAIPSALSNVVFSDSYSVSSTSTSSSYLNVGHTYNYYFITEDQIGNSSTAESGTFTVTWEITAAATIETPTATIETPTATIEAPTGTIESITLSAVSTSINVGDSVALTSINYGNIVESDITYTWSASGGTVTGSGNTASFSANTYGTYTVTVNASARGGTVSVSKTINITVNPIVDNIRITSSASSITGAENASLTAVIMGQATYGTSSDITALKGTSLVWTTNGGTVAGSGSLATFTGGTTDGNYTVTASISSVNGTCPISVNANGPVISATSNGKTVANSSIISANPDMSFTMTDLNGVDASSISVTIDSAAVSSTALKVSAVASAADSSVTTYSVAFDDSYALSAGTHTITVSAKDAGGLLNTITLTGLQVFDTTAIVGIPMNYPNPFKPAQNQTTTIKYTLTADTDMKIMIYDITGKQQFSTLCTAGSEGGRAGANYVVFDGKNAFGTTLGNGVYYYFLINAGKVIGKGQIAIIN